MFFTQTLKNIRRAREVAGILAKYGFEEAMVNTPLQNLVPKRRRVSWSNGNNLVFDLTTWERVRMVFEELGATFVKGAQVLSNRPDILPEGLIKEFQKLQSSVAPFSFEKVKEIIQSELGKPLSEIFLEFDETPIGSASIGQVHLARLFNGDRVVVKVQRPDVKKQVETDLSLMKELVKFAGNFFERNGIMDPLDVVIAFEKSMQKELDYRTEARNISQFRTFYKDRTDFYVPAAYKEYSTEKILVLEFVKGCKITDLAKMKEWGIDPTKIAHSGMHIYLTQIFEFGFFHADPHPGNIIIQEDGRICLIDFGMVGRMSRRDKLAFAGLFISMAQQDARAMASYFRRLAIEDEIADIRTFEADLQEIIDDFAVLEVKESNMAEMANRMQAIIYKYRLKVPGAIFIIFRALAILEGIGKLVHPDMNTMEEIRPYGQKLLLDLYSPKDASGDALNTFNDLLAFLNTFPSELKDIVRKLRQGKLHTQIGFDNYDEFARLVDNAVSRLTLTFIIVALIIASAMMVDAQNLLRQNGGMPYLSLFGFITAGFLMIILLFKPKR